MMHFLLVNDNSAVKKIFNITAKKAGIELDIVDKISDIPLDKDYSCIFVDDGVIKTGNVGDFKSKMITTKFCIILSKNSPLVSGFDSYIRKPFLPTDIYDVLKKEKYNDMANTIGGDESDEGVEEEIDANKDIDLEEFSDSEDEFLSGVKDEEVQNIDFGGNPMGKADDVNVSDLGAESSDNVSAVAESSAESIEPSAESSAKIGDNMPMDEVGAVATSDLSVESSAESITQDTQSDESTQTNPTRDLDVDMDLNIDLSDLSADLGADSSEDLDIKHSDNVADSPISADLTQDSVPNLGVASVDSDVDLSEDSANLEPSADIDLAKKPAKKSAKDSAPAKDLVKDSVEVKDTPKDSSKKSAKDSAPAKDSQKDSSKKSAKDTIKDTAKKPKSAPITVPSNPNADEIDFSQIMAMQEEILREEEAKKAEEERKKAEEEQEKMRESSTRKSKKGKAKAEKADKDAQTKGADSVDSVDVSAGSADISDISTDKADIDLAQDSSLKDLSEPTDLADKISDKDSSDLAKDSIAKQQDSQQVDSQDSQDLSAQDSQDSTSQEAMKDAQGAESDFLETLDFLKDTKPSAEAQNADSNFIDMSDISASSAPPPDLTQQDFAPSKVDLKDKAQSVAQDSATSTADSPKYEEYSFDSMANEEIGGGLDDLEAISDIKANAPTQKQKSKDAKDILNNLEISPQDNIDKDYHADSATQANATLNQSEGALNNTDESSFNTAFSSGISAEMDSISPNFKAQDFIQDLTLGSDTTLPDFSKSLKQHTTPEQRYNMLGLPINDDGNVKDIKDLSKNELENLDDEAILLLQENSLQNKKSKITANASNEKPQILDKQQIDDITNILEGTNGSEAKTAQKPQKLSINNNEFDSLTQEALGEVLGEEMDRKELESSDDIIDSIDTTNSANQSVANQATAPQTAPNKNDASLPNQINIADSNVDVVGLIQTFPTDKLRDLLSGVQITVNITFPTKKPN